jgi:hypothetical protein
MIGMRPPDNAGTVALYTRTASGAVACRLCHGLDYAHARTCPLVALRGQLCGLAGQLGLLVGTLRETMDTVDRWTSGSNGGGQS